jgi:hypothetical protein
MGSAVGDRLTIRGSHRIRSPIHTREGVERQRSNTQAGREENDALARGIAWSFIDSRTAGLSPRRFGAPQRCTVCQVFHAPRPLPALLRVASLFSFVPKVILTPAPGSLLRATRLAPVRACFSCRCRWPLRHWIPNLEKASPARP